MAGDEVFAFGVDMKADAALATEQKLEEGLHKIEATAATTGQKMAEAMNPAALKNAEGQYVATAVASSQLKEHVDQLVEEWQREDAVLERIKGPAREYEEDLKALNSLHQQGKVGVEEYEAELEKMNRKMGETGKGAELAEKLEGGLDIGKGLLAGGIGGGIAGGVMEIGEQIESIVESSRKLKDEYIEMTNASLRFADATHTTDDVINEQSELAEQLHSTFGPTIALYGRVKEGSDALGLSHENQIRLTKTLGQEVELAGRPLDEASNLMAKFAFAMEGGTLDARQLQTIMREVTGIADIWTAKFHTTAGGIVSAMKNGKISVDDLVKSLIESGDASDRAFSKHQATNAVLEKQFEERVKNTAAQRDESLVTATMAEAMDNATGHTHSLNEAMAAFTKGVEEQKEVITNHTREALRGMLDAYKDINLAAGALTTTVVDLARKAGIAHDPWKDALETTKQRTDELSRTVGQDHAEAVGKAKMQLVALHDEYKAGQVTTLAYRSQYEALLNTIRGGETVWDKLSKQINDPVRDAREQMAALNAMVDRGAISWDGYATAYEKARKGLDDAGIIAAKAKVSPTGQAITAEAFANIAPVPTVGGNVAGDLAAQIKASQKKDLEDLATGGKAMDKFIDDRKKLDEGLRGNIITQQEYDGLLGELRDRYNDVKSPEDEFRRGLELLREKLDAGIYSTQQFTRALDQLKLKTGQGDFTTGLRDGLRQLEEESNKAGTAMGQEVKKAVDGINTNIADMVVKGKADWGGLVDSIESDMIKLSLKKLEGGLFSAASGAMSEGGASGVVGELGGALLGHQMGASWTVPGYGGGDSVLTAFMAAPGEQVTVTPRGQQDAGAGRGAGGTAVHIHNHYDPKALVSTLRSPAADREIVNHGMRNRSVYKALYR